ncbi:hypothetical protein [Acetobacterium wieringae]|uniref:hypothetical protein n=1 Tax=Acetobacterium wieringae TaxID=52694 RepID=UPI00203347AF|nr:hypothetical protein [Acetobacterium wieringae]URN85854.1 hypothetical protein CHL1_001528 [Acetobacterium wieringae]
MCKTLWFRVHVEGVGWSDWIVEEVDASAISEAFKKLGNNFKEAGEAIAKAWESVSKALYPTIEFVNKIAFEYFNDQISEKKKIYEAECRMKSNVKKYGYNQNYRKRMFCVGGYGNFRRF